MRRRLVPLALASVLLWQSTVCLAADIPAGPIAPELVAKESGNVSVERRGDENPVMEVARSTFWGAVAGSVVGLAVAAIQNDNTSAALRWGFAIGTFAGLGTGIYFVSTRAEPASLLEIRDGHLVPNAGALAAVEVAPDGVRVRAVGVRF